MSGASKTNTVEGTGTEDSLPTPPSQDSSDDEDRRRQERQLQQQQQQQQQRRRQEEDRPHQQRGRSQQRHHHPQSSSQRPSSAHASYGRSSSAGHGLNYGQQQPQQQQQHQQYQKHPPHYGGSGQQQQHRHTYSSGTNTSYPQRNSSGGGAYPLQTKQPLRGDNNPPSYSRPTLSQSSNQRPSSSSSSAAWQQQHQHQQQQQRQVYKEQQQQQQQQQGTSSARPSSASARPSSSRSGGLATAYSTTTSKHHSQIPSRPQSASAASSSSSSRYSSSNNAASAAAAAAAVNPLTAAAMSSNLPSDQTHGRPSTSGGLDSSRASVTPQAEATSTTSAAAAAAAAAAVTAAAAAAAAAAGGDRPSSSTRTNQESRGGESGGASSSANTTPAEGRTSPPSTGAATAAQADALPRSKENVQPTAATAPSSSSGAAKLAKPPVPSTTGSAANKPTTAPSHAATPTTTTTNAGGGRVPAGAPTPTVPGEGGQGGGGGVDPASEREHLEKLLVAPNKKDRSTTEFYSFGKVVGTGSFAKVRVARHKLTGMHVAIKTYEKAKIKDPNALKRIKQEIALMEKLDHPLVSRFFETIESKARIHLVMEFLGDGNLCTYIKEKRRLPEDEARAIFCNICRGLEYMHANDVVHRDIKLENVLFDEQRNAKLIDFGFSVQCKEPKRLKVFCGTPSYMAPEIVKRSEYRGKPVDMWSVGVVLFAMLSGCFPFSAKTYPDLYKKILRGTFTFPDSFSPPLRDLIKGLLCMDPARRLTVSQARAHPWARSKQGGAVEKPLALTPCAQFAVSEDARHDLYREVVSRMVGLGINREELVGDVIAKRRNSMTTCYYLLAVAMRMRHKPGNHHI